jgi:hypothetical protein
MGCSSDCGHGSAPTDERQIKLLTVRIKGRNNTHVETKNALEGKTMKINGIEVRSDECGGWVYLQEGYGYDEPDAWHSVRDVMGPFGGSGVEQLFELLEKSVDALRDQQKVIDMLMPGAVKIAIQDYQLLNEAPMRAGKLITEIGHSGE